MKVRNVQRHADEEIELQMTPMIDIVFQLLIFFIMTFKIVAPEGDFNIKMPRDAPSDQLPPDTQLPPIKITLRAAPDGSLAAIQYGQRTLRSFDELHGEIRRYIGDGVEPGAAGDGPEVELDCDHQLRFDHVMAAITAVSGYIDPDTKAVVRLIDKIKFSPPHEPAAP